MQDVIEGLWLHVTEDRLQADHSKKFHFQKNFTRKTKGTILQMHQNDPILRIFFDAISRDVNKV